MKKYSTYDGMGQRQGIMIYMGGGITIDKKNKNIPTKKKNSFANPSPSAPIFHQFFRSSRNCRHAPGQHLKN